MAETIPDDRRTTGLIVRIIQERGTSLRDANAVDFEDIVQECELYVNRYKHNYDPLRGKWSTFVRQIVLSALPKIRAEIRKRLPSVDHREFEYAVYAPPNLNDLYVKDATEYTYSTLSDRERLILEQLAQGRSQGEIAELLDVKRPRVSQIIKSIRTKFHKALYA
jgi:RNA polymerase sigma factor (sigma-70 family)